MRIKAILLLQITMWLFDLFLNLNFIDKILIYLAFFSCIIYILKWINFIFSKTKKFDNEIIKTPIYDVLEVTDKFSCENVCHTLRISCQNLSALGFDCEWVTRDGKRRPIALLQLATYDGLCVLFRLNLMSKIYEPLRMILSDKNILKTGVSAYDDAQLLLKDYNVQVNGVLDLRYLYDTTMGLGYLSQNVLGFQLNKDFRITCSNWESPNLTPTQTQYAAEDAFVAIEIFKKWLANDNEKGFLTNYTINYLKEVYYVKLSEIIRCLDIPYTKNYNKLSYVPESAKNVSSCNKKLKTCFVARKTPLYDNCFMHAPDGELLCSCDKRKAEWYVENGLAEITSGEPFSIRLLFEPKARGGNSSTGRFYQQLKKNCCVVCGKSDSYLRHRVVPKEYRKHFPKVMKEHQSHDVVLTCVNCHHLASQHNNILRQELAIFCDAPIKTSKVTQNKEIQKIKNCAKALLVSSDVIPFERKQFLENEIKGYFETNTITEKVLNIAANLEANTINDNYESHGIKVVNFFSQTENGLLFLEVMWRIHFVMVMEPKFLPALWCQTVNVGYVNNT